MTAFDDRKTAAEAKFTHDQEFQFKTIARRNKLLGLWAAEQMGICSESCSGPRERPYATLASSTDATVRVRHLTTGRYYWPLWCLSRPAVAEAGVASPCRRRRRRPRRRSRSNHHNHRSLRSRPSLHSRLLRHRRRLLLRHHRRLLRHHRRLLRHRRRLRRAFRPP